MLEILAYALNAQRDETMRRRYERSGAWVIVLQYLLDNESLADEGSQFLRQFLTFVYLSETQ